MTPSTTLEKHEYLTIIVPWVVLITLLDNFPVGIFFNFFFKNKTLKIDSKGTKG